MNTKVIFSAIGFAAGAVASGLTTWLVTKKYYEKKVQAEIDSIWAELQKGKENPSPIKIFKPETDAQEAIMHKPEISDIIARQGYTAPELPKTNDYIYEIAENDLDEDEYECIDLTLYTDGVLADDQDYVVQDVESKVGAHYREMFNGKDEVFIRNEKLKIDYDICLSQLSYPEMRNRNPAVNQRLEYNEAYEAYENDPDLYSDEEEDEEE